MVANCSTDKYVGCIYNKGDGKCHHPRVRQGCALPRFEPGRINCLWGVRHFDAADMIRIAIVSSEDRVKKLGEEPDYELEEHQREVEELDRGGDES